MKVLNKKVKKELFVNLDFIFILFLMIIDETDNLEYFLYKYNISKINYDNKIILGFLLLQACKTNNV